jgi:hypothetical protein
MMEKESELMATPNVRGAYELLRRAMQQHDLQQQGSDFGSTPNGAPEDGSESYGSPQGGLLGRLLALQAERSGQQPFAESNGQPPTDWQSSDYGDTPKTRITVRPQSAIGPSDLPGDEPEPANAPFGVDLAAQPNGPIANTSVPAVRLISRNQNLSRTLQNPSAFANNMTGIGVDPMQAPPQARTGLFDASIDRALPAWMAPSPTMMATPMGWRVGGIPIPPMMPMPLPQMPPLTTPDAWKTAWKILQIYPSVVSGLRRNGGPDFHPSMEATQAGGGITEDPTTLGSVAASLGGPTILNNQSKVPALASKPASPQTGDPNLSPVAQSPSGLGNAISEMARRKEWVSRPDDHPWLKRFRKQARARAAARHAQVTNNDGNDPDDFCSNRRTQELRRCYRRYPDYAHTDFLEGCKTRSAQRWESCNDYGGQPDPNELAEWDLDPDEELFLNLDR